MAGPEAFARLRARLEELGFRPSQTLGQNFLVDPNLLDAIARDAEIEDGETVVEVGPGPAWLTRRLAARARRVVAVELDRRLAVLARESTSDLPNVEVVEGDALAGSKRELHPAIDAALRRPPCVVVANLPYSIAPPFLATLVEHRSPPRRAVVMVQREVADRLLASAGSAYGALTVAVRAHARVERVREVPAAVFRPRPKVRSTLLRFAPLAHRPSDPERRALHGILDLAFAERRKQLASRLGPRLRGAVDVDAWREAHGLRPDARPEDVPVDAYVALARAAAAAASPPFP